MTYKYRIIHKNYSSYEHLESIEYYKHKIISLDFIIV